jgi:hypothetical protein
MSFQAVNHPIAITDVPLQDPASASAHAVDEKITQRNGAAEDEQSVNAAVRDRPA